MSLTALLLFIHSLTDCPSVWLRLCPRVKVLAGVMAGRPEVGAFPLPAPNSLPVLCPGPQNVMRGHPATVGEGTGGRAKRVWAGWSEVRRPAISSSGTPGDPSSG